MGLFRWVHTTFSSRCLACCFTSSTFPPISVEVWSEYCRNLLIYKRTTCDIVRIILGTSIVVQYQSRVDDDFLFNILDVSLNLISFGIHQWYVKKRSRCMGITHYLANTISETLNCHASSWDSLKLHLGLKKTFWQIQFSLWDTRGMQNSNTFTSRNDK